MSRRIKYSLEGPSEYARIETPPLLMNSLKIIVFSFFIIEFSNLLSHLSPLIFGYSRGYLFVGASDLLLQIGFFLLPLGLLNLQDEILYTKEYVNLRYRIVVFYLIIMDLILLPVTLIENSKSLGFFTLILGFISLIVLGYFIIQIWRSSNDITNPVLKLRMRILRIPILLMVVLIILYIIFFAPLSNDPSNWPTRNPRVELIFLVNEIFAILSTSSIFIAITLPRWVRKLLNLTNVSYFQYRDYRFDYFWSDMVHIVDISEEEGEAVITPPDNKALLVYADESVRGVTEEIAVLFNLEQVNLNQLFKEEYLRQHTLPSSNIIIIAGKIVPMVEYFLNHIWANYQLKINYQDQLLINDHYTFKSDKYRFAFFGIFPSIWNIRNKIILILGKPELNEVITDFIANYSAYYRQIGAQNALFSVIQFPVVEGVPLPLPPAFENASIPDQTYIKVI